jgi:glucose/arabinose dehydrogenase
MKKSFYVNFGVVCAFVMVTLAAVRPSSIKSAEEAISQLYLPVVGGPFKPTITPFISNMDPAPVVTDIVDPGDKRLFIAVREGRIMISTPDGTLQPDLLLDIRDRVYTDGNEMGLLGLAVHPNFASNGQIYVHYTERLIDAETLKEDYFSVIARYLVGANGIADPATEKRILRINLPTPRHHGGAVQFGPQDGYLYLSLGDGGTPEDIAGNAQSKDSLLGKILRIDVDGGDPYAIPADNPFVNEEGSSGEIWAMGFRNPWRFSFDRQNGDMFIGDVGEFTWEEIDHIPAGSGGGANFGWPCMEGPEVFNPEACDPDITYTPPIFFYLQDQCAAVTAGYMYRGAQIPDLVGRFLLADLCKGTIWSLRQDDQGRWNSTNYGDYGPNFTTFGERSDGELFMGANRNKNIYQIVAPSD